jgi:branched-subunit amino acid aminotransferase/4-amino-4-deoxychorismate lyase
MDRINSTVTTSYAWLNGTLVNMDRGLSLNSRALWYGDGVFETIAIQEGRPLKLGLHMERLSQSADSADLTLPLSPDELTREVVRAAAMTSGHCILRLMLYRGGNLGLLEEGPTERIMMIQAAPRVSESIYKEGIKIKLRPFTFQDKNPRKSLDWSHAILELRKARQQNFDDILMFNQEDGILEASSANIFFLGRQGDLLEVATPPLSTGILPGTTRHVLIELLHRAKIPVTERLIFPDELPRFDEAFLTSTIKGLVPIQKINSQSLFTLRPHSTFREFERLFQTWQKVQTEFT